MAAVSLLFICQRILSHVVATQEFHLLQTIHFGTNIDDAALKPLEPRLLKTRDTSNGARSSKVTPRVTSFATDARVVAMAPSSGLAMLHENNFAQRGLQCLDTHIVCCTADCINVNVYVQVKGA